MQVWDNPVTHRPTVEPMFAAAMHGVELCGLSLAAGGRLCADKCCRVLSEQQYRGSRAAMPSVEHSAQLIACVLVLPAVESHGQNHM